MSDLIRREEVIKTIHDHYDYQGWIDESGESIAQTVEEILRTIPTAEPKEYVKDGTLTVQMPTIKEAKAVDKIVVYADTYKQEYHKPKVGKWIDLGDFEQCSVCAGTHLKEFETYYGKATWIKSNYCPHCGAKMEGSE